jgi:hypothetical protein
MQNDSLQQIAQGHILLFGDCLEHLQHALFHPDPGLNAFNFHWFTILLFL